MRILYIGQPDTERSEEWVSYLSEAFGPTEIANIAEIGSLAFDAVDIAIVDGESDDEPRGPAALTVEDLPVPTVLVGSMGGQISDAIGLKLGWAFGCRCLNNEAILSDADLQHPIFQGPARVPAPEAREIDTPEAFSTVAATKQVPATLTVADIYEPTAEERAANAMPGLVSTSTSFLDSPDCEHILGGINSKMTDYNAIARQGRYLQWGFHSEPSRFTPFGRALFENAVHYIAGFADAPVEALVMNQYPREMLRTNLGLIGHPLAGSPEEMLTHLFGGHVPNGLGETTTAALTWFADHRGEIRYVGTGGDGYFAVDDDLVALGFGNDDLALLDEIAGTLDHQSEEGERARRLWSRYLGRPTDDIPGERAWFAAHRESLFFSDWAGYRWIARDDLPSFSVPRVGTAEMESAFLWLVAERRGDDLDLALHINLMPGDYIYAPGATDGVETSIDIASGHTLVSDPEFPDDGGTHHLSGRITIPLTIRGDADTAELSVRLQVCNAMSCTVPTTVRVTASAGSASAA